MSPRAAMFLSMFAVPVVLLLVVVSCSDVCLPTPVPLSITWFAGKSKQFVQVGCKQRVNCAAYWSVRLMINHARPLESQDER